MDLPNAWGQEEPPTSPQGKMQRSDLRGSKQGIPSLQGCSRDQRLLIHRLLKINSPNFVNVL